MTTRGPLGHNWDFNYNRRLTVIDRNTIGEAQLTFPAIELGDVIVHDGGSGISTENPNTASTLQDTTRTWVDDQWADRLVENTGGTGAGQVHRITGNTGDTLTVAEDWATVPDDISDYRIVQANRFEEGNLLSVTHSPDARGATRSGCAPSTTTSRFMTR